MPAYFRFLTILAFHVFLQEEVQLLLYEASGHKDPHRFTVFNRRRLSERSSTGLFVVPQVDLAVIEVGIGGAYDCTNIIR